MSRHDSRREGKILLAGMAVSLVVHAALGVGFVRIGTPSPAQAMPADDLARVEIFLAPEAEPPAPDPVEPPEPPPPLRLGVDQGSPEAEAWLGFAEATEHAARLASIEQSAMSLAASDETGPSHTASPPPGTPGEAPDPAEVAPAPPTPPPEAPPAPPAPEPAPPQPTPAELAAGAERMAEVLRAAINLAADAARELTSEIEPPAMPPSPPPQAEVTETPAAETPAQPPAPPPSPPAPADAGNGGAGAGPPQAAGIATDRESAATAIRQAPTIRPGRVLAAQGLEIQTRAPRWSHATTMLRRPRNPTVEIAFGADGRVRRAVFASDGVRTYDTGFEDVDQPLLSAIYTWTAKGKPIEELASQPVDTSGAIPEVRILMTIMFN